MINTKGNNRCCPLSHLQLQGFQIDLSLLSALDLLGRFGFHPENPFPLKEATNNNFLSSQLKKFIVHHDHLCHCQVFFSYMGLHLKIAATNTFFWIPRMFFLAAEATSLEDFTSHLLTDRLKNLEGLILIDLSLDCSEDCLAINQMGPLLNIDLAVPLEVLL